MTRHVAEVREGSGTCRRKLKFNQAFRRDDHFLESIRTELRGSVATQVEVVAEKKLFGCDGMELRIVVAKPQHGLTTLMQVDLLGNEYP